MRNGEDANSILMIFPSEELKDLLVEKSKNLLSYKPQICGSFSSGFLRAEKLLMEQRIRPNLFRNFWRKQLSKKLNVYCRNLLV